MTEFDQSDWTISLVNISKRYDQGGFQALRNINLVIPPGQFVAIMGNSGCGKSTLLNLLAGIDLPDSGAVHYGEINLGQISEAKQTELRKRHIGFVFQFFNLLSTLTVMENIILPLELNGYNWSEARKRAQSYLSELGLSEKANHYPSQLSGGQMQRVALIRAVIHHPKIVLADEPTGNLDTENGQAVLGLLKDMGRKQGHTVVMATHSEEAASFADCVVRMKDGQLI